MAVVRDLDLKGWTKNFIQLLVGISWVCTLCEALILVLGYNDQISFLYNRQMVEILLWEVWEGEGIPSLTQSNEKTGIISTFLYVSLNLHNTKTLNMLLGSLNLSLIPLLMVGLIP